MPRVSIDVSHAWTAAVRHGLACLVLAGTHALASPVPDPTFGGDGLVVEPLLGLGGSALLAQPRADGRVMVVGNEVVRYVRGSIPLVAPFVVQFLSSGDRDATFGASGRRDPPSFLVTSLAPDGRIWGTLPKGIASTHPDGAPDTSVRPDGAQSLAWFAQGMGLREDLDGKLLAFGSPGAIALARFNRDGALDPSFNYIGALVIPPPPGRYERLGGLALQPDGRIVLASSTDDGYSPHELNVLRLWPNGIIDESFGGGRYRLPNDARVRQRTATAAAVLADGRVLVAGMLQRQETYETALFVLCLTATGELDLSYGVNGMIELGTQAPTIIDSIDLELQTDQRPLLIVNTRIESTRSHAIIRLTRTGAVDPTFGSSGTWYDPRLQSITGIAHAPDGKLVVWGTSRSDLYYGNFAIARYLAGPAWLVEYHHVGLDHYFVTANPQEIDDLDRGVRRGWTRTGQVIAVSGSADAAAEGESPACRYYIPPGSGDSHFFSASANECAAVATKVAADPAYAGYVLETPAAFWIALPDASTGACAAGREPVYRLWNGRADSNHRYTTSRAIRAQMLARGYVAEGYGPDGVAMCSAAAD